MAILVGMGDKLEALGETVCTTCGETRSCYYAGGYNAQGERTGDDAICADCYADAVGHGRMYETVGEATDAVEFALGFAPTKGMVALIAAYY